MHTNNQSIMDEDLRFYEPPRITMGQRIKVAVVSFGTGFLAATMTAGIVAVIQVIIHSRI